jgi:hypothetical protein
MDTHGEAPTSGSVILAALLLKLGGIGILRWLIPLLPYGYLYYRPLILVLGGSLGFSDGLYNNYPSLSLSPLTFPHELARVVIMEQLYRAATILQKKNYHY